MTTVVIGHGRSPEGKGWGYRIDACSTVLRMWDWSPWQRPVDYGERYDYGFFVLTPKQLEIFNRSNKPQPRRGWVAHVGKPTSGLLPDRTELVDAEGWTNAAVGLGGHGLSGRLTLTRGCIAACWAIERASYKTVPCPPSSEAVVLVGFDNVQCGINQPIEQSFSPEYWKLYNDRFPQAAEKVYPIGGPRTAAHDMSIELPLLQRLAKMHNVELLFAHEVWK